VDKGAGETKVSPVATIFGSARKSPARAGLFSWGILQPNAYPEKRLQGFNEALIHAACCLSGVRRQAAAFKAGASSRTPKIVLNDIAARAGFDAYRTWPHKSRFRLNEADAQCCHLECGGLPPERDEGTLEAQQLAPALQKSRGKVFSVAAFGNTR